MENDKMDIDRFEMHWEYYLAIEKMLQETRQYVSTSNANAKTYSDEFAKIILLSCAEIDSILEQLCKIEKIDSVGKNYTMKEYAKLLEENNVNDIGYAPFYYSALKGKLLISFPFKNIDHNKAYANLEWWNNYQKIKHNRIDNVELGNLKTAVFSLAAHYIVIRLAMNYIDDSWERERVKSQYESKYFIDCV